MNITKDILSCCLFSITWNYFGRNSTSCEQTKMISCNSERCLSRYQCIMVTWYPIWGRGDH